MHEKSHLRPEGKYTQKGSEKSGPFSYRASKNAYSHQPDEPGRKYIILVVVGGDLRSLASLDRNTASTKLNTALVLPNKFKKKDTELSN